MAVPAGFLGSVVRPVVFILVMGLFAAAAFAGGCTGAGPDKNATAAPPGNATATPPAVSGDPATAGYYAAAGPYDYESGLQRMPEVRTAVMGEDEIARYRTLLGTISAKDPGAARWVAGAGLFAEDRKVTDDELAFASAVSEKKDPLRILVTPWARDGAGSADAGYAKDAWYPSGEYGYLTDDLQAIESARGPVDPTAKERLRRIITASAGDYELRKGICIIDEYGVPPKDAFGRPVPAYNTQLAVLMDLLKTTDVPPEYYRVALAAGIDYGAVETVGDNAVRANLPGYVKDQVAFTMETDRVIRQNGAGWQAKDYPLEADIALLWGAAGTMRPWPFFLDRSLAPDAKPWGHPSFESDFFSAPMGTTDFDWSFVSTKNLKAMQEMMTGEVLPGTLRAYIAGGYRGSYNVYEDAQKFSRRHLDYPGGKPVFLRDRTSINLDWQNYTKTQRFDSACYSGDLFFHGVDENACYDKLLDEKTLARSINVAALPGAAMKHREDGVTLSTYTHLPVLLTYDHDRHALAAFPSEKNAADKYNRAISHHTHLGSEEGRLVLENLYFAAVRIPWDNFAEKDLFSRVYMDGTTTTDYSYAIKGGFIPATDAISSLPSGYLFRHRYAVLVDYEKR